MSDECVSSSWLELESDPGLFTLLIDDFGVKGVQVEEIYDLSKPLENSIFGFIFLFKWIERRSRRSKGALLDPHSNYVTDPNTVNKMFFAHQIVPNSCATHALLSVLLNCKTNKYLDLGDLLTKFRNLCQGLTPENKGFAIGNQPKLAEAHNSYAKPESNNQNSIRHGRLSNDYSFASSSTTASSSLGIQSNQSLLTSSTSLASSSSNGSSTAGNEIFHFICFVPINGRLYELDGLKPYPVDHGSITSDINDSTTNWTVRFKQIIRQRLNSFNNGQQNHEIRFNLMALVPDKMVILQELVDLMKFNKQNLNNSINEFIVSKDILLAGTYSKIDKEILYSINKYEQEFKSDNQFKKEIDFNNTSDDSMKSKLIKIDLIANNLNEDLNTLNKSNLNNTTRQLRSTRSANHLNESIGKCDQFQFEIIFQLNDDLDMRQKIVDNLDLHDLIKQYKIESIKFIKCKNEQNDMDNEFKQQEDSLINEFKLDNDKLNAFRKRTTLTILKQIESKLELDIETEETKCNEEIEKRKKYRIDALRRKHIYDEFIVTYLNVLSESGKLAELIQNSNGYLNSNGTNLNNNSSNLTHSNGSSCSKHSSIYSHSASKKLKKK